MSTSTDATPQGNLVCRPATGWQWVEAAEAIASAGDIGRGPLALARALALRFDATTGLTFRLRESLASQINASVRSVTRWIAKLAEVGLVQRWQPSGRTCNTFALWVPVAAVRKAESRRRQAPVALAKRHAMNATTRPPPPGVVLASQAGQIGHHISGNSSQRDDEGGGAAVPAGHMVADAPGHGGGPSTIVPPPGFDFRAPRDTAADLSGSRIMEAGLPPAIVSYLATVLTTTELGWLAEMTIANARAPGPYAKKLFREFCRGTSGPGIARPKRNRPSRKLAAERLKAREAELSGFNAELAVGAHPPGPRPSQKVTRIRWAAVATITAAAAAHPQWTTRTSGTPEAERQLASYAFDWLHLRGVPIPSETGHPDEIPPGYVPVSLHPPKPKPPRHKATPPPAPLADKPCKAPPFARLRAAIFGTDPVD